MLVFGSLLTADDGDGDGDSDGDGGGSDTPLLSLILYTQKNACRDGEEGDSQ